MRAQAQAQIRDAITTTNLLKFGQYPKNEGMGGRGLTPSGSFDIVYYLIPLVLYTCRALSAIFKYVEVYTLFLSQKWLQYLSIIKKEINWER